MGKSRKRCRSSSSSDESSDEMSKKSLLKRLRKLEKKFERGKRKQKQRERETSVRRMQQPRLSPSPSPRSGSHRSPSPGVVRSLPDCSSRSPTPSFPKFLGKSDASQQEAFNLKAQVCNAGPIPPDQSGACSSGQVAEISEDVVDINILPDEILSILGADPNQENKEVISFHDALVSRWNHLLEQGLKKDETSSLLQLYPLPTNIPALSPPSLNPEVQPLLTKQDLLREGSYVELQRQLGIGLGALGRGVNALLEGGTHVPRESILTFLSDSGRILTNLFHRITVIRRNLITPVFDKNIRDKVSDVTSHSGLLFGSDLIDKIRNVKSLEQASKQLKPVKGPSVQSSVSRSYKGTSTGGAPRSSAPQPKNFQSPARYQRDAGRSRGYQPSKTNMQMESKGHWKSKNKRDDVRDRRR
ncbi:hypothetical protein GE061_011756 [Apolygus lucorum]|uniref:Uncharacterized protein n=1 Tax=Apolygus lucorum TaxID=248454 RepID=A0A6A4JWS4_APOLU|nr:hypothetical protein GE061_011756 [Apolygus lucorum]